MMAPSSTAAPEPAAESVRIREADGEGDAWYLQRQWAHYFGAEYESQTALQYDLFGVAGWTVPDDAERAPHDTFGVIAEHRRPDGRRVRVGGGLALLLDAGAGAAELDPASFDSGALVTDPTAWFLLGAVDPAWRGRGIGAALFDRRVAWARDTDAGIALAFGWERAEWPSSRPLFESRGWMPLETIDGLYGKTGRTSCPDCGVWPSDERSCRCDGTIWALEMGVSPDGDD